MPRWPRTTWGQCSVCLSGFTNALVKPLFQHRKHCFGHLTTQGFLQAFATGRLLKAVLLAAEIGRTAHPLIEANSVLMVADHPPELAAIQELAAGHAATQDLSLIHI